jgi:hypothetical protein
VSAAWVAGSVRARLLLERRAGVERVRQMADATSFAEAVVSLAETAYAPVAKTPRTTLEEAQRAVAGCTAVQLRVLAAWLPPDAKRLLRALAAWFELANIEDRLAYLAGGELRPAFELGVLSSIWDAAASAQSAEELRGLLQRSSWGDPGAEDPEDVHLALRLAWARRVATEVPEASAWAAGGVAILVAGELFVADHRRDLAQAEHAGLGKEWARAATIADLRDRLPAQASWALAGIDTPHELWRAELGWWRAVGSDAEAMTRSRLEGREVVVGAIALLGLDAVRVASALAVAAQARSAIAREALDALC